MVAVVGYIPTPEGRAAIERAVVEARDRGLTLLIVNATRGDASVLLTRPISLAMLIVAAIFLVVAVLPSIKKKRDVVFAEDE